YLDLSGSGLFRWGMLRKGIDMIGAERILFGSDFPVVSSGMTVAGVLFEHITPAEQSMIFRENFLRLTQYDI
ncbi:MAG: amidohydrolase family protein, partial [Lentisphaeria bacterium]|nr:amidohydrolase family protein [Lentisphaeria bacterium]